MRRKKVSIYIPQALLPLLGFILVHAGVTRELASKLKKFYASSLVRMASNTSLPPIELGENSIVVSGAGLAGSLLACHLSQKGLNVNVIERRPDPRKEVLQAGRSINLALSERGINAMREVGILEDVMKITIPMYCRAIHLPGMFWSSLLWNRLIDECFGFI